MKNVPKPSPSAPTTAPAPRAARTVRVVVLVMYTLGVVIATLSPVAPDVSAFPSWIDKPVHVGMIAGFAGLSHWVTWPRRDLTAVTVAALALAGLIELIQGPIPNRSPDIWDFAAGGLGSFVGSAAFMTGLAARRSWTRSSRPPTRTPIAPSR